MKQPFILTLMSTVACAATATNKAPENTTPTKSKTPNVVFIYADDLGYGDLECYGAKNVQTPNVNRLAKSGILFTNAHATAATSTPSRYSMLTGEYAWRKEGMDVAAGNAGMIIRPEQYTMADMFKSVGYATAAVGKWHLGLGDKTATQDWNAPLPCALGDLGFDYHYIMAATADRVPCVYIENGKVANYDPSAPIEVSYQKNFEDEPTGKSNPELLYNLKPSHGHDMSIVNGISRIGFMKGGGKALWKDENIADSLTTHAIQFIEENKNKPFFLYFATNDVHVPRFPHPWVIEQASNHTLSVRTKDWKYIEPNDGPKMIQWGPKIETGNSKEPQLYKMKEVKEVTNYAKNMPEKVAELQNILQSVREGKDLIGK